MIQGDTSRELSWTEDEEMPTDGQGFEKREGGQEAIRRKKPDVRKPHEGIYKISLRALIYILQLY